MQHQGHVREGRFQSTAVIQREGSVRQIQLCRQYSYSLQVAREERPKPTLHCLPGDQPGVPVRSVQEEPRPSPWRRWGRRERVRRRGIRRHWDWRQCVRYRGRLRARLWLWLRRLRLGGSGTATGAWQRRENGCRSDRRHSGYPGKRVLLEHTRILNGCRHHGHLGQLLLRGGKGVDGAIRLSITPQQPPATHDEGSNHQQAGEPPREAAPLVQVWRGSTCAQRRAGRDWRRRRQHRSVIIRSAPVPLREWDRRCGSRHYWEQTRPAGPVSGLPSPAPRQRRSRPGTGPWARLTMRGGSPSPRRMQRRGCARESRRAGSQPAEFAGVRSPGRDAPGQQLIADHTQAEHVRGRG